MTPVSPKNVAIVDLLDTVSDNLSLPESEGKNYGPER